MSRVAARSPHSYQTLVLNADGRPLKQPRRPTSAELPRAGLEFLPNEVRLTWGDFLYWGAELEP